MKIGIVFPQTEIGDDPEVVAPVLPSEAWTPEHEFRTVGEPLAHPNRTGERGEVRGA